MTLPGQCLASMARLLSHSFCPLPSQARLIPSISVPSMNKTRRNYAIGGHSNKQFAQANRDKKAEARKKRKQLSKEFNTPKLDKMEQFTLCDAMRVIRAFEVGQPPSMAKYDLALRLVSNRHSRPIRNRIVLPHPVKMTSRIIVMCPEGSTAMEEALRAGAVAAGEESLFQKIKDRSLKFNKVIAHVDSMPGLAKARLGPILRNLMPSPKTKTVTRDVGKLIREMSAAEQYRERMGTIRVCVGQMGFTPQMLADNVKAFMTKVKDDIESMDDDGVNSKSVHEVVLSSTHGPGLSLSGGFVSVDPNIREEHLQGPM